MRLGDFQSMLQLTVGLNVAYFAFREIRMPVLNRLANEVAVAEQLIDRTRLMLSTIERPQNLGPDELSSIWDKATTGLFMLNAHEHNIVAMKDPAAENIGKYENFMRPFCMGAAGVGFIVLCISSIFADFSIERLPTIFIFTTALSLIPTAWAVLYNWSIASIVQNAIDRTREWAGKVKAIHDQFSNEDIPRYRELRSRDDGSQGTTEEAR